MGTKKSFFNQTDFTKSPSWILSEYSKQNTNNKDTPEKAYVTFAKDFSDYANEGNNYITGTADKFNQTANVKQSTVIRKGLLNGNKTYSGSDWRKYDVNYDGVANANDALTIEQHAAGLSTKVKPLKWIDSTGWVEESRSTRSKLKEKRTSLLATYYEYRDKWKEIGVPAENIELIENVLLYDGESALDDALNAAENYETIKNRNYYVNLDRDAAINERDARKTTRDGLKNSYKEYDRLKKDSFESNNYPYEALEYEWGIQRALKEYGWDNNDFFDSAAGDIASRTTDIRLSEIYQIQNEVYNKANSENFKDSALYKAKVNAGKNAIETSYEDYWDLEYLTDEEKEFVYYLLGDATYNGDNFKVNTYEKDAPELGLVNQYVDSYDEIKNQRQAQAIKDRLGDNVFTQISMSGALGVSQFSKGISNLFNDDEYIAPTAADYLSGMIREDLGDKWKIGDFSVAKTIYDVGVNIGNQAPSILASIATTAITGNPVAGQVVGTTLMGASAAGNAYAEMLNMGYSKGQAATYGTLVGVSEGAMSYMLSGISALGGNVSGKLIDSVVGGFDNALAAIAVQIPANMLSEFTEESLQAFLEPYYKEIAGMSEEDIGERDWGQIFYEGLLGAFTSGPFASADAVSTSVDNNAINTAVYDGDIDAFTATLEYGLLSDVNSALYKESQKINKTLIGNVEKNKSEGMDASQAYTSAVMSLDKKDVANLEKLALADGGSTYVVTTEGVQRNKNTEVASVGTSQASRNAKTSVPIASEHVAEDNRKSSGSVGTSGTTDISKAAVSAKRKNGFAVKLKSGENVGITGVDVSKGDDSKPVYITNTGKKLSVEHIELDGSFMNNVLEYIEQQEYGTKTAGAFLRSATFYEESKGSGARTGAFGVAFDTLMDSATQYGTTLNSAMSNVKLVQAVHSIGVDAAQIAMNEGLRRYNLKNGTAAKTAVNKNTASENKKAVKSNRKASVEIKSDAKDKVNNNVKAVLTKMSELGNMKIVVENFSEGDASRGYYQNGVVHLNSRKLRGDYFVKIAVHESVHHVKVNNLEGYNVLEKFVAEYLKNKGEDVETLIAEIIENRKQHGETLDRTSAMEELVANALSDITTDANAMEVFLKLSAEEKSRLKSVLKAIAERIKEFARKLTGVESRILIKDADVLKKFASKLSSELETAGKQAQKNTARNSGVKSSYVGLKSNAAKSLFLEAERMSENGINNETIRKKTGWFKGYDSMWRFEIADSLMKLKSLGKENTYFILSDLIEHKKLFDVYPSLKYMKVKLTNVDVGLASYNTNDNTIRIDKALFDNLNNTREINKLKKILIHEIQHAIQDIEGFAGGSTPNYWLSAIYNGLDSVPDEMFEEELQILNELSEIQRTKPQFYNDMVEFMDRTLLVIQESNESDTIERHDFNAYRDRMFKEYGQKDVFKCIGLMYELDENLKRKAEYLHFNTAGEIEAMDVSSRLDLTEEQRKNTRPDIDRADVVFADSETNGLHLSEISDADITMSDIHTLRSIGRKSVNEFSSNDISKSEKWARKFYKELGVKSPFFRSWFGDWRAHQKLTPVYPVKIPQGVKINYDTRIIKNMDTNYNIRVEKDTIEDSIHYAGKDKLYLERLLSNIDTVLQNAILLDTAVSEKDAKNKKGSTQFMHYFYSIVEFNGNPFLAKIAVEEYNNGARRAYNLQRIKMSALSRAEYNQIKSAYLDVFASSADAVSVADLHSFVKLYDKKFKPKDINQDFINEDGTPKVFYHGTDTVWTEYDLSKNRNQMWGDGIYLTPDPNRARLYGKYVMPFYVKADTNNRIAKLTGKTRDYTVMKKTGDILVYSPNQIKSATDNIGTFDKNKKDTHYSYGDEEVDLWGLLDPEESGSEEASERLQGFIDTAQQILALSREVVLSEGKVRQIVNSVLKKYTGKYNTEYAERIELILDAAFRNKSVSMNDVVGEVASVIKDAVLNSEYTVDVYADVRNEVVGLMQSFDKVYLTQEQIDTLTDNDRSLAWFRQKMFGKVGILKQGQFSKTETSSFETLYRQLMEAHPEWFEEVSSNNMPLELYRTINAMKPQYVGAEKYFHQSDDVTAVQITSEIVSRVVDAKYEHSEKKAFANMRDKLRSEQRRWIAEQESTRHAKNVEKYTRSMLKWIDKPTKKQSVPEVMREPVRNFLRAVNEGKEISAGALLIAEKLRSLEGNYQSAIESGTFEVDSVYLDIDPGLTYNLEEFAKKHDGKTFSDLDGRAVGTLDGLMLSLRNTLSSTNRLHQNMLSAEVSELAENSIVEFEKKKDRRFRDTGNAKTWMERFISVMDNTLLFSTADAFTFQKMLGSAGESVMQEMWAGYEKFIENVDSIRSWTDSNIDIKKVKKWRKQTHSITLSDGSDITLTVPQIMELYALAKRKRAQGHIYGYGIVIDRNLEAEKAQRIDGKKSMYKDTAYMLTVDEVVSLTSKLTDEQTMIANKMQRYLTEDMADLGNEVTLKRYLYKAYVTKNYWPIQVFGDVNKVTDSMLNPYSLYAVANPGFSKQTQEGANNAIVIHDIFTTFSKHCGQMAMLNGMSIPLTDALKWYNYTNGNKNVKGAMKNALSIHANKWFIKFLSDLNNQQRQKPGGTEFAEMLVRGSKSAAIWGNMRVVLQQFSAYTRSADVIKSRYLIYPSNLKIKSGIEKALKYCPVAKWKSFGFFTTDIGNSLENIILPTDTAFEKVKAGGFALAGKADEVTWGILWNACEKQALHNNSGVTKNSEEHMKLTAEILTKVVNDTQVVDSPFHRSQIRRNTDMYSTLISSFMDEPIKSFNMLRNSIRTGNPKAIVRSVTAFTVTSMFCAMLESLWDIIRNSGDEEEEEEKFYQKYFSTVWDNFLDNIKPWKLLPALNKLSSVVEGWSSSGLDENGVSAVAGAVKHWIKRFTDDDYNRTLYADLYETAKAISYISGIGVHTVMRDITGIANLFLPDGLKMTTQPITKSTLGEEAVEALLSGDKDLYDTLYNDLLEKCGGSGHEKDAERVLYNALSKTDIARQAYDAKQDGNKAEYGRIVNDLIDKGFSLDVVVSATNSLKTTYNNQIKKLYEAQYDGDMDLFNETLQGLRDKGFLDEEIYADLQEYQPSEEKMKLQYDTAFCVNLLENGKIEDYNEVCNYLVDNGKSTSTIKSAITKNYKSIYVDAWLNSDTEETQRIEGELYDSGLYENEAKKQSVSKTCTQWLVDELKEMYLSTDDPDERADIRTKFWKTGKWDDLNKMDKQIAKWVEKDKG